MSVLDTLASAVINGILKGISSLFSIITDGILQSVNWILSAFGSLIGTPMQYWETNELSGLTIPIIFTLILGVAVMVGLIFLNIYGIDEEIQSGLSALEEL